MTAKILVCDDDRDIAAAIEIYLTAEGYEVRTANNGLEALDIVRKEPIDLVIMDIMMPKMNGIEAARRIREDYTIPLIMLSAKSEDNDIILGLNIGADDYVTKPYNPLELIARVKSQLRRAAMGSSRATSSSVLENGGLSVDDTLKQVLVDGEEKSLTPAEYKILKFLMENKGRVYSSAELYERVWGEDALGADNIVAVHIRHIREKIEIDPKKPKYLKVVWGHGYKMERIV